MLTNCHCHPLQSTRQATSHQLPQLAVEPPEPAPVVEIELRDQLSTMLEEGLAAARQLQEVSVQLSQRLAQLDAYLCATLVRPRLEQAPDSPWTVGEAEAGREVELPALMPATATAWIDFDIHCLGLFAIYHAGQPLSFPRNRKVAGLLKYLVMHHERPVPRDVLMRLGWPDAAPDAAANDLNTTISVLRGHLSKTLARQVPGSPIVFEDGHYRLNPRLSVRLDVGEFDACCRRGLQHERRGREHEAMAEYQAAVALYRGDLLMGDLYDDWTIIERERLASTFLTLLSKLAAFYMARQRYEEAIDFAHRLLEHDPCREDAHCLLMRCFARLGQRTQALRQYDLCRTLLDREMQIEPAPETIALQQSITRGDPI